MSDDWPRVQAEQQLREASARRTIAQAHQGLNTVTFTDSYGTPSPDLNTTVPRPLKLGLKPPTNNPALKLGDILTGTIPAHPAIADHFKGRTFGLYENDRYSDCGPTGVANHLRMVSGAMLGAEIIPSQQDVFDLYRTQNPSFNPTTGTDDDGVVLQSLLGALLRVGIGNGKGQKIKPLFYGKVAIDSDAELEAAASIFGALWGVGLQVSQQQQSTSAGTKTWDYVASPDWGGHCVMNGAYEQSGMASVGSKPIYQTDIDVESWNLRIRTTPQFRQHQLQEAWVIVWPWLLTHPGFQAGVDLAGLRSAFKSLTGRTLAV